MLLSFQMLMKVVERMVLLLHCVFHTSIGIYVFKKNTRDIYLLWIGLMTKIDFLYQQVWNSM